MNNGTNPTVNVNVNTGYNNPNPNTQQKSKIAGGLLGIFLGGLGVHNFYLGYTGKAVAQLLISLLSCGFLAWASAIWGLIEGILILTGSISVDGMTRAFLALFHFDFLEATYQNILSIPLFCFLVISVFMLCKDFIKNEFSYIPKVLDFLGKYWIWILILLFISFVFNNLK